MTTTEEDLVRLNQEMKERLEHRDVLESIKELLTTNSGRRFVKYLFKNLDVCELPAIGMTGDFLMDRLGFLRAGNSIFKIVAEANHKAAGEIIAQIEKDKYDEMAQQNQI